MQKRVILQQYFISHLLYQRLPRVALSLQWTPFLSTPKSNLGTFCERQRGAGFRLVVPGVKFSVVTTSFSIGVLLQTPIYYTADSHHLVSPKYSPDPEKQRLSENYEKILAVQLFQAVFSAEDTNKLWCTEPR